MDRLWATWRMAYITGKHKDTGCVFCNAPKSTKDEEVLILQRQPLLYYNEPVSL